MAEYDNPPVQIKQMKFNTQCPKCWPQIVLRGLKQPFESLLFFLSGTEMTKIISSSFHDFMSHRPVPADQYIPDESFYY